MTKKKGFSYRIYCKRIKYASKFGRLEHNSARLCFLSLLLTLLAFKLDVIKWAYYQNWISIFLWLVYWISHRIEKKLYPNRFRF